MNIQKTLEKYGLTEKQAKIYLATLELGSAPVNLIAKKSTVPRPTCYDILESLQALGIASTFTKKKTRYYSVQDPKKIVQLAEQKAQDLKQALPELEAIYGLAKERPKVRFFQGKDGIQQILEEILEDNKDYLAFSSADDLFSALEDYYPKFIKRRIKQKLPARVILKDTPKAHQRQQLGQQELRQVKIIPKNSDYHGGSIIFGNKIAFLSFIKDYVAVVIESKELTDIQRAMFEYIWHQAD